MNVSVLVDSHKHANADITFSDVNGDCLVDILAYYEGEDGFTHVLVLLNTGSRTSEFPFQLQQDLLLPSGVSSLVADDVDSDGLPELIVSVCNTKFDCRNRSEVVILRRERSDTPLSSQQCVRLETSSGLIFTQIKRSLFEQETSKGMVLSQKAFFSKEFHGYFALKMKDSRFVGASKVSTHTIGNSLRTAPRSDSGDYRFSALCIVVDKEKKEKEVIALFRVIGASVFDSSCTGTKCGAMVVSNGFALTSARKFGYFAVADVNGDAVSDFVVQHSGGGSKFAFPRTSYEAYSLQIMASARLSKPRLSEEAQKFGTNSPGACTAFSVLELSERLLVRRRCFSLPQVIGDLSTPFWHFGLSEQSSLLPHLEISLPETSDTRSLGSGEETVSTTTGAAGAASFTTVIPNSQLVLLGWTGASPSRWKLSMYVNPSARITSVLVVLISTVVVLALLTLYLTWKEVQQDKIGAQDMIHAFTFES